jgi:hypothetical protein
VITIYNLKIISKTTAILCLLMLFVIKNSIAQLINTAPQAIEVGTIHFNPETIKKNKVKSIDIRLVNKPDGATIVDKGKSYGYRFNELGYVTRYFYTVFKCVVIDDKSVFSINKPSADGICRKYINDTIFVDVIYDSLNRIIEKKINNDQIYNVFYYTYNENGRLAKEVHCKETNISDNPFVFKRGEQIVLSSETFAYSNLTPTQIKKESYNTTGFPFKYTIINYDVNKNILSETTEFIVSWKRTECNYTYDLLNRLVKKSVKNNGNTSKSESIYEYGKNGNLLIEKQYKDGELIIENNYLYDEQNLVKAEANRNFKSTTILMVKYKYEYY